MVCRHRPGDPACSSSPEGQARLAAERAVRAQKDKEQSIKDLQNTIANLKAQLDQGRIDAEKAEVLDIHRAGQHIVLKVKYPSCTKCSYEGVKIMVYLNVTEVQLARWRVFDPHFQDPGSGKQSPREAPSPAARFPASAEGWQDAIAYAVRKATEDGS